MLFFFLHHFTSSAPDPFQICPTFSNTDCMNCWDASQKQNVTCGWCSTTKTCTPGDSKGPVIGTCANESWHLNDSVCSKESEIQISVGTRVGVSIFAGVVAIGTAVFWIWIFPRIFSNAN